MKIAILSDTHDNILALEKALGLMDAADAFIHCGDLCSPFIVKMLGEAAQGRPMHIVWGNNEGDIRLICSLASKYRDFHLHGALAEIDIDNLKIGVNHYPEIARPLAESGRYDVVCYGHDHIAHLSRIGDCTLLNPGELLGLKGPMTFARLDSDDRSVEFVEVELA